MVLSPVEDPGQCQVLCRHDRAIRRIRHTLRVAGDSLCPRIEHVLGRRQQRVDEVVQQGPLEVDSHPRGGRHSGEVEAESIGDVDHRRGGPESAQCTVVGLRGQLGVDEGAQFRAGGIASQAGEEQVESGGRASDRPGQIERITGASTGAQCRGILLHRPERGDGDDDEFRGGQVAADDRHCALQRGACPLRLLEESGIQGFDVGDVRVIRYRQGYEKSVRGRTHGADVGEVLCRGLASEQFPVQPVAGEVLILHEHVCG